MKIEIAERLKPFSHIPGMSALIPKSSVVAHLFPTRIRFADLSHQKEEELLWDLSGPFDDFTFIQDLEKAEVRLFAHAQEGYFRLCLKAEEKGIGLLIDRSPAEGIEFSWKGEKIRLKEKEEMFLFETTSQDAASQERLSLGCHKKQDWELVNKRRDLKEILPIWFRLSSLSPTVSAPLVGTASYLERIEDEKFFENLFSIAFNGILVPRLVDSQHQGIIQEEKIPEDANPMVLLSQSRDLIRKMFFAEEQEKVSLLAQLPKEFPFGRFANLSSKWGEFDIEWSKKLLRRVVFRAKCSGKVEFSFQKSIQSFRVRKSRKDKGKIFSRETSLLIEKDQTYFLDRFQK